MQGQSEEHLRLLSIFHYIFGALTGLFGLFFFLYPVMGAVMVSGAGGSSTGAPPPPAAVGWIFIAVGLVVITLFESLAISSLLAGRYLSTRRAWTFCFVVAVADCIFMVPIGTVLGVFTIIVLLRPEVKQMFGVGLPYNAGN